MRPCPRVLRDGTEWKGIRSSWQDLAGKGPTLTAAENTAAHTELVGRTLDFMVRIADEHALTLDAGFDSYYLMDAAVLKQPIVLERLARMRALGTAALSRRAIDEAGRVDISVQLAELVTAQRQLLRDLDKVAEAKPALAAALREHSRQFAESGDRLVQIIKGDILAGKFATASSNYYDMATAVIDSGYQLFNDRLVPALRTSVQARIDTERRAMVIIVGIALLALLACAYLMLGMSAAIGQAVGSLHESAKRLADGDLRARTDIGSRDEFGEIATAFNAVAGSMHQLIGRVQGGVSDVTAATARLRDASANIRSSTATQSEAAAGMAAAVEQMTVGVDEISRSAEEAHRLSRESGELSARGGQIVTTVVEEIEKISRSVHEAALAIGELGRNSEQISTIVSVIKGIADQTNLLALNAAIEAARAGESGRGFAVVADEVRNLAVRTAESTSAITDMVTTIQRGAQEAVTTMENGVVQVNQGVQMAREAGDAMLTIRTGTGEVVRVVNEISAALHEQTTAATEIARNVERIAQMSDQNSSAVANNADTAENLDGLATSLHQAIGRFRV